MFNQSMLKSSILKELYFLRHASCAEISDKTGKSFPLIQKQINEMIDDDLLEESGLAPSTGGRRPAMYRLKAQSLYTVSIAMDQYITRISVIDTNNKIVFSKELECPLVNSEGILKTLYENTEDVINKSGVHRDKIIGVGVGMPGFIDFQQGENYSFFQNEEKSFARQLNEKLKLPVYLDNDSSLIALAEYRFGSAKNQKHAMVINIGWGVGLGMILNGELFRGHNGFAGEFSHIPLFNNNKLCQCGKSGCLETESSLLVTLDKVREGLQTGRVTSLKSGFNNGHLQNEWKEVVKAAMHGDQFVIETLSEIGYNIGRGIAILIHLINPETVILSGRGAIAGKLWLAPIQQALNEHCIPRLSANTTIGISSLGDEALSIGCSALVIEHLDTVSPLYVQDQNFNGLLTKISTKTID
jgi:predicted NBD/HSP70 family sugar kinase